MINLLLSDLALLCAIEAGIIGKISLNNTGNKIDNEITQINFASNFLRINMQRYKESVNVKDEESEKMLIISTAICFDQSGLVDKLVSQFDSSLGIKINESQIKAAINLASEKAKKYI